jgi:hypothetical protein
MGADLLAVERVQKLMLPSYAHVDTTRLNRTLEVFRAALLMVGRATRDGSLEAKICIPLLREM